MSVQPVTYQAKMVQIMAAHPDSALSTLAQVMQPVAGVLRGPLLTVVGGYVAHHVTTWVAAGGEGRAAEWEQLQQQLRQGARGWPALGPSGDEASGEDYARLLGWAWVCLAGDVGRWRRLLGQLGYEPSA